MAKKKRKAKKAKKAHKLLGKNKKSSCRGNECAEPEVEQSSTAMACEKEDDVPPYPGCLYTPGRFNKERFEFIAATRDKGKSHREACAAWNLSNERARLLEGMPEKEMKRRRFA